MPSSHLIRKSYWENLNRMANGLVIQFNWTLEQAGKAKMSEVSDLFVSDEFKTYQKNEIEKFKTLLKTIVGSRY